jgi:hypothetical protein
MGRRVFSRERSRQKGASSPGMKNTGLALLRFLQWSQASSFFACYCDKKSLQTVDNSTAISL